MEHTDSLSSRATVLLLTAILCLPALGCLACKMEPPPPKWAYPPPPTYMAAPAPTPPPPSPEEEQAKKAKLEAEKHESNVKAAAEAYEKWTAGYTREQAVDGDYVDTKNFTAKVKPKYCYRLILKIEDDRRIPGKDPSVSTEWPGLSAGRSMMGVPGWESLVYTTDEFCPVAPGTIDVKWKGRVGSEVPAGPYRLELWSKAINDDVMRIVEADDRRDKEQLWESLCAQCQDKARVCIQTSSDCTAKFNECKKGIPQRVTCKFVL